MKCSCCLPAYDEFSQTADLDSLDDESELSKRDDKAILEDLGYTQELYRGVTGWFMNFAFTFTAVSVISSYSISFDNGLTNGGPVVMVWGWVVGSFFTICVGFSLAEICSTYPSTGSVYHWSGMLAREEWAPFFSYLCGWFNLLGNAAGDAAFSSGFATMISAMISYTGNTFFNTNEAAALLSISVLLVWSILNVMRVDQQGWINNFAAVYQVLSTIVTILVLFIASQNRAPGYWVFTGWYDGTGFTTPNATSIGEDKVAMGYVVLIGLLTTLFAFSGYEAGGHLAEETRNARKSVPRGLVVCCVVASVVGFAYIIALLWAIPNGNIEPLIPDEDGPHFALSHLFNIAVGEGYGLVLLILIGINVFFAGISSMTVTSRIAFALARDGALPFSSFFYHVQSETKSPVRVVILIFIFDAILLTLQIPSATAFEAILSLTTIGFQISYSIPIWLRITHAKYTFPQGIFNLGKYSLLCGWVSALWLTFTSLLFFFPFEKPITSENMNYTIVVVGTVTIIAVSYWYGSARVWFKGPRRPKNEENLPTEHASLLGGSNDKYYY